jgi:outer membrane autotransporter protein
MKVAELVAEAELNLQGISSDTAKEKGGLNLKSNDTVSLETGVGLKIRKRIQLAKQRELMLAIGTKYYHELLDPYKDLSIGMNGSPINYHLKGYDEDKNRLRTAAEAMYKDGSFAVSAEIAHNAEKEESVEGGVGVRYNF